jgi:hypothetical protein
VKQEYLVYVVESTNDYIAYCGFDTEEEARDAAQRMTLDVDYPEILSVGVHNHPVEDPDDGSWRRIAVYCCGKEWVPKSEATVVIEVESGVASVDECPDWINVVINDLDDPYDDEYEDEE